MTVLDGELDSDTESLPVAGSLGDVFTDPVWVSEEKVYGGAAERAYFFGDRPRGPILGAREDEEPTSPPVALK